MVMAEGGVEGGREFRELELKLEMREAGVEWSGRRDRVKYLARIYLSGLRPGRLLAEVPSRFQLHFQVPVSLEHTSIYLSLSHFGVYSRFNSIVFLEIDIFEYSPVA